MSIAAIMVHVDVERDCEQRVQFALDLADAVSGSAHWRRGLAAAAGFRGRRRCDLPRTHPG